MSKTSQIVLWVIIGVIVVGGGIWWWAASMNATTGNSAGTNQPVYGNQNSASSDTVSTDTSDSAMDQDMTNINAQMNGLSSDSANVDSSMNATTTQQ